MMPTTIPPGAVLRFGEFQRRLKAVEEEFIQSGPTHLLEAVYCDPCKAKVMDKSEEKYSPLFPRFSATT